MSKLEGRVAIVTGAGSGIGQGIALRLARDGAAVVVACRHDAGDTVGKIQEIGGKAAFVPVDVTDEESVKNMVKETVATFGRLDILVNNAGIFAMEKGHIDELDTSVWNAIINVNLTGTFLCSKYAIPELLKSPCANIVNIASAAGVELHPLAAYAASKAGVIAMTRTTAVQYPGRIRANAVLPGSTRTPGLEESRRLRNIDPTKPYTYFPFQMIQREGTPDDVAPLVAFVVSDEASFIDAAVLRADGGYIAPAAKVADVEAMNRLNGI